MTLVSRRWFLSRAAEAAVATSAIAATAGKSAKANEREPFKHPAEYIAAMQAIGWQTSAMYRRLKDGSLQRMGVNEKGQDQAHTMRTWTQFHAVQMRAPVQLPMDVHPAQDWWALVWQFLYDKGLYEEVMLPQAETWEGDEA